MILGHATNTFMIHRLGRRFIPWRVPFLALLVGAYLPDLVDKPLAYLFGVGMGRGLFHSVVVVTLVFCIAARCAGGKKNVLAAVYIGSLLHFAQDTLTLNTLLWPLLGPWTPYPPESVWEKFVRLYAEKNPFGTWVVEMISAAYCIGYALMRAGLKRRRAADAPSSR